MHLAVPAFLLCVLFPASDKNPAAKLNPDADGIYHVGDGVTAPRMTFSADPETNQEERQERIRGSVILHVLVTEDGKPTDVHVSRSIGEDLNQNDKHLASDLDKNAMRAVERDRFEPALFKGKPVPVGIEVKVNYRIK